MGLYSNYIFPRLMDWVLRAERIREERRRLLFDVHGEVLEIGFGTGLNLPHYPRTVTRLHAPDSARLLPDRVTARVARVVFPVHVRQTAADTLPYEAHRFDFVVSMFTLCRVSDPIVIVRMSPRSKTRRESDISGTREERGCSYRPVAGSTQPDSKCIGLRLQFESPYRDHHQAGRISLS